MNRLSSLLAGGVTVVLAGAIVAGVAADQGVLSAIPWPELASGAQVQEEVAETPTSEAAVETTSWQPQANVAASTAAQPTLEPVVQYVDKEPIVHTEIVRVPAPQQPTVNAAPASVDTPTAQPTQAPPPTQAPVVQAVSPSPTVAAAPPQGGASSGWDDSDSESDDHGQDHDRDHDQDHDQDHDRDHDQDHDRDDDRDRDQDHDEEDDD